MAFQIWSHSEKFFDKTCLLYALLTSLIYVNKWFGVWSLILSKSSNFGNLVDRYSKLSILHYTFILSDCYMRCIGNIALWPQWSKLIRDIMVSSYFIAQLNW